MAPLVKPTDPSIERTTEYEEFIAKLAAYHEKRGYENSAWIAVGVGADWPL